jgi:riboflavin kinase / FMN adenylyltransferase
MRIYRGIQKIPSRIIRPVIAVGVFDGLHRGHVKLIHAAVRRARQIKGTAVVITFHPHPVHVLRPKIYLPLIICLSYRLSLLESFGVQACVILEFNKKFSRLSPEKFIQNYLLKRIKPAEVFIGNDFRFGQDRKGTGRSFRESGRRNGFTVKIIPVTHGGQKDISSTRIRKFIAEGKIKKAAHLLGRPVSLLGRVKHGDTRGQKLGYRTANLYPSPLVILPHGVFVVQVRWRNKVLRGMANVGYRPSFKRTGEVNVEVHLFDFKMNLYGENILVEFLKKIREEKQFWSQEELISQLRHDEQVARQYFRSIS